MTCPKSRSRTASWYMNSGHRPCSRLAMCGCEPVRSARVGNVRATSAGASQKRHRLGGEALAAAGEAEPVGRGRAHGHPVDLEPHRPREPCAHRNPDVRNTRLLADQDAVRIHELEAAHPDDLVAPLEQADRGHVEPLGVGRGEELADVALSGRAEDRVDQSVRDHVAVRVPRKPGLAGKVDACEHERDPLLEAVRVDPEPDPEVAQSGTSGARSSIRTEAWCASGQSFWMNAHGPRTRKWAAMPALAAGITSLSIRSPTYAISPGAHPASATIRAKKSPLGFSTPQRSDDAMKSTSTF